MNIGRHYRRQHPQGDQWDSVVLRGVSHVDGEVVISPVEFGPAASVTVDSLAEHYVPVPEDDPRARVDAQLERLEAVDG